MAGYAHPETLVETAWVAKRLNDPKVRIAVERKKVRQVKAPARKVERPPEVNPRVTAAQALRALKRFPGGEEVIAKLRKAGKKI